ncbi:hypothetical protein HX775_02905 [Serratia proteamaculans]|uniref:hypothetical protein n=1 Tax=Serratia proteamaculans TaxID=28151 RepID=UPI0015A089AE|nr:hypothetical protein [Serratia proteamaculans]NWA70867.1 hypothetical protein [Serratia proteamaculans]
MDTSEQIITEIIQQDVNEIIGNAAQCVFKNKIEVNTDTLLECLADQITLYQVKGDKKKSFLLSLAIKQIESNHGNK